MGPQGRLDVWVTVATGVGSPPQLRMPLVVRPPCSMALVTDVSISDSSDWLDI